MLSSGVAWFRISHAHDGLGTSAEVTKYSPTKIGKYESNIPQTLKPRALRKISEGK